MTGRTLHGVTLYDPVQAYRGFTLFTPMGSPSFRNVWLIDMEGRIVHRWRMVHWSWHAVLLSNGNLLFTGKVRSGVTGDMPGAGGIVQEVAWDGNVVWQYEDQYLHHDVVRLRNGNTLVTKYIPIPEEMAAKVKGGLPGTEWHKEELGGKGVMWGDAYQEITPGGRVSWEWKDYEHLDPEIDILEAKVPRKAWAMNNSFCELSDGNIIVSWVWLDTIAIIEKTSGKIIWRYGPSTEAWQRSPISFQHNPTILPNGNILLFDNGRHRIFPPYYHPPEFSRVIEINPKTSEIEWEYKDRNVQDFYSPFMAGCERLPNNNTLICEAAHGRIFEVTYNKEKVWEYVSPFYYDHPSPNFGLTNMFFRAHRYGPDYPGLQGKDLAPTRYETWNRLYCPEAYAQLTSRRVWTGAEVSPPATGQKPRLVPTKAQTQEEKPPSPEEERNVGERLKSLGY